MAQHDTEHDTQPEAPNRERLEELEDRIEKARRQAEDEVPGIEPEDEPRYYESGATPPEQDDQIPPAG